MEYLLLFEILRGELRSYEAQGRYRHHGEFKAVSLDAAEIRLASEKTKVFYVRSSPQPPGFALMCADRDEAFKLVNDWQRFKEDPRSGRPRVPGVTNCYRRGGRPK